MNAPLKQRRCGNHGGDDILGRRRDAHAENETGYSRKYQREKQAKRIEAHQMRKIDDAAKDGDAMRKLDDGSGKLETQTGEGRRPDDETDTRTGRTDCKGVFRTQFKRFQYIRDSHSTFFVRDPNRNNRHIRPEGREGRLHIQQKQPAENHCRNDT